MITTNKKKKIYLQKLDAIRGFAALYVMLGHSYNLLINDSKIIDLLFSFGQEAVIVFFIISGFVIYLSCVGKKQLTFKKYFLKRFTRIYLPLFLCWIISLIVFSLNGKLSNNFSWQNLIGNLLMLQDTSFKPGNIVGSFLGNTSLWSLSYEWWFYMLFFPIYKLDIKYQKYLIYPVTLFSCVCWLLYLLFPNKIFLTFSYFIIWWSGVELAKLFVGHKKINFSNTRNLILCLIFMTTLTLIPIMNGVDIINYGVYPFLTFRHFLISVLIIIFGIIWYQNKFKYFNNILGRFVTISPISYTLYIFHYPILVQWDWNNYLSSIWITYILKTILLFSLCYLVEIKLQKIFNHFISHRFDKKIA